MREFEASELLVDLADQALVRGASKAERPGSDFTRCCRTTSSPPAALEGIAQANRSLISGYRKQCPNGWATATDDGYLFNSLSYHSRQQARLLSSIPSWISRGCRRSLRVSHCRSVCARRGACSGDGGQRAATGTDHDGSLSLRRHRSSGSSGGDVC